MSRQNITYNDFSFGELSHNLFGRGNVNAYRNSAMNLTNFDVIVTGGIERRCGTKFITELDESGKLVAFEYSSDKKFLLFFGDEYLDIYNEDEELIETLSSPYEFFQLPKLCWSQKGQDIYFVHPDVEPMILRFDVVNNSWDFSSWVYAVDGQNGFTCQPYVRFDDTLGISLKPNGVSGNVEIIADNPMFTASYVGLRLLLNNGEVKITSFVSSQLVRATVSVTLSSTDYDANWQEQAFSKYRGYPSSIAFYQNRLVLGGTKFLKNRLWFSKIGEYMNFDLGTGLDDEAIEFDIFSEKVNQIVSVFAGKHLQVFTTDSEWAVTGNPITPSNISVMQQTKIGSIADRYVSPKFVEGSTIFVARSEKEIREFFYGDLSDSYASEDLILLSSHLLNHPVEQDYNVKKRKLYVVQEDGTLAVLLINKSHSINAWTQYKTFGKFKSLAVLVDKVYVVVERNGYFSLEVFDENFNLDCAKTFENNEPVSVVSDLDFYDEENVMVVADGKIYMLDVEDCEVTLPEPAQNIIVGFPFTHVFCPLPVFIGSSFIPKAVRLLELGLRVMDTKLVQVDVGSGLRNANVFDGEDFSGDLKIRGKGFVKNYGVPLFKIQSSEPYKVKILNISMSVDVVK